jgi:GTPase SAR1 family protein/phage-related protein
MDSQQRYEAKSEEIKQKLKELRDELNALFGRNLVEHIKTDAIKRKLEGYIETGLSGINEKVEDAIKVLDSPIHVGLVGRYSHGKTALVNALFDIDEEFTLPEGEGIVTSKVTYVEFDKDVPWPKCYECLNKGGNNEIDIDVLRANVSGKAEANSAIGFYKLKIPARSDFAMTFAERKINLIDMPGFGGLYAADTKMTDSYIKACDMLLVIIKLTEIDNAGKTLDSWITGRNMPIIPVLTFLDKWDDKEEGNRFINCANKEEVLHSARQALKEHLPSLEKCAKNLTAVSSRRASEDATGIDNLRTLILGYVAEKRSAIEKIKNETPEIYRGKIKEVEIYLQKLAKQADDALSKLEKDIISILPRKDKLLSFSQHYSKDVERNLKEAKKEIHGLVREMFSDFTTRVNDVRNRTSYSEITNFRGSLVSDLNSRLKELKKNVQNIFGGIKDKTETEAEKYIDSLAHDTGEKNTFKKGISGLIKNSEIDLDDISHELPDIGMQQMAGNIKTIGEIIIEQMRNPQFLMTLCIGVALALFVSWIPKIGSYLSYAGWILIAGSVLYAVVIAPNHIKEKNFRAAKENIVEKFAESLSKAKDETENKIYEAITQATKDLLREIDQELPIDEYGQDLKNIAEATSKFKDKAEVLNRFLATEIEKLGVVV